MKKTGRVRYFRRYVRLLSMGVVGCAVVLTGCDPYYSLKAKAQCPDVGVDRIGEALRSESALATRRVDGEATGHPLGRFPIATFWSERRGITAAVHVFKEPGEVEVTVGSVRRPSEEESRTWEQHREFVCELLGREIPQVGEWRREDFTGPSGGLPVLAALLLGVAVLGLGWAVFRRSVRDR